MIRHAGLFLTASPPVFALVIVMIEPPAGALLVPFVGLPPLLTTGLIAAPGAAIAVPAIAVPADEKHCVALPAATDSKKENRFAVYQRHTEPQAGLDNEGCFVTGWKKLCLVYLTKVAEPGTPPLATTGFFSSRLMPRYFVRQRG